MINGRNLLRLYLAAKHDGRIGLFRRDLKEAVDAGLILDPEAIELCRLELPGFLEEYAAEDA